MGSAHLCFYSVPDDFDVWDAVAGSPFSVEVSAVSPEEERPADRRSVNINFNFSTKKVLMVKLRSDFHLAVSEVEFFTCTSKCAWLCFYYRNACGNFINPVATVQMTTEPQSIDDMTKTPAIITTITTTEINVITTGSTFTTSEITTSISQDQDIANVTVTGLGKSYSNACNTYSFP